VPLQSIALAPAVDAPSRQQLHQPLLWQHARVPFQDRVQQQVPRTSTSPLPPPAALVHLSAAAERRQRLPPVQTAALLLELQPQLARLGGGQLAQAAWAAAALAAPRCGGGARAGSAAAGGVSERWQQALLDAALAHFAARTMPPPSAAKLLQALVKLRVTPPAAWLAAACEGMAVDGWRCPRSLSTVAACLPQLGHVPSASWAARFFAACDAHLAAFPATSLARTLHGVVAWQHLQLARGWAAQQQQALVLPQPWLRGVLQQLHAATSQLKPPEVAMVLQAVQRLQQHAASGAPQQPHARSSSGSGDNGRGRHTVLPAPGCQADNALQLLGQQLLHALLPAVLQQLAAFTAHDLSVVLYALAQLQLQAERQAHAGGAAAHGAAGLPECCTWPWLQHVLTAVQVRRFECEGGGVLLCAQPSW
jgi:hypothetical protein